MKKLVAMAIIVAICSGCTPLEPQPVPLEPETAQTVPETVTSGEQEEREIYLPDKNSVLNGLRSLAGSKILLGQYLSQLTDLAEVEEITGQQPAILMASDPSQLDFLAEWSEAGGIPGLVWYWEAPGGGLYKSESGHEPATDFQLSALRKQFPKSKLETMALEEWPDAPELVKAVDQLAEALKPMKDRGFLFRPLPQGAGGWYWWSDTSDYSWLWMLLKLRLEEYHGLENLIWVWNGMGEDWYQPDCDMVSGDFYGLEAGDDPYLDLYQLTGGKKLLAASEMEAPLTANALEQLKEGRRLWSWYGLWNPSYLYDPDGAVSNGGRKALLEAYKSPLALDLEGWLEVVY